MKSDLAIAALFRSRMTELGLSRGEFAKRLGYKNIAKGIRRIDVLCGGDVEGTKQFLELKSLWQPRRFQDPVRCVNHFRVPGDAELSPGCRAVPNFMGALTRANELAPGFDQEAGKVRVEI